jgi:hypothetical protein
VLDKANLPGAAVTSLKLPVDLERDALNAGRSPIIGAGVFEQVLDIDP